MALTVTDLSHGTLTTSAVAIVNSVNTIRITHCTMHNKSSAAVEVKIYYIRTGESVGDAGTIKVKEKIPPGKTFYGRGIIGQNMAASSSVFAVADANGAIDYNLSGDVIS